MGTGLASPRLRDAEALDDLSEGALALGERFDRHPDAVRRPDHQRTVAA
jgi:hypothetical protein